MWWSATSSREALCCTCVLGVLLELLRVKLFMDMRPKAFGSTIPPGGGLGVTDGRLCPCVSICLEFPFVLTPALPQGEMISKQQGTPAGCIFAPPLLLQVCLGVIDSRHSLGICSEVSCQCQCLHPLQVACAGEAAHPMHLLKDSCCNRWSILC